SGLGTDQGRLWPCVTFRGRGGFGKRRLGGQNLRRNHGLPHDYVGMTLERDGWFRGALREDDPDRVAAAEAFSDRADRIRQRCAFVALNRSRVKRPALSRPGEALDCSTIDAALVAGRIRVSDSYHP